MLGIDLGNEYAVVAAFTDRGPRVLGGPAARVPNCVAVTRDGEVLAGEDARKQQAIEASSACTGFMRKLGDEDTTYTLNGKTLTPTDCAAAVLRVLAKRAREELDDPTALESTVVVVPAWFHDGRRTATKQALETAGLKLTRMLNEPAAVAMAWSFQQPGEGHRTVMTLNLGARHFDVTLMKLTEMQFEVLSTNGLSDEELAGLASGAAVFEKIYPPIREAMSDARVAAKDLHAILLTGDLRHRDELNAHLKGMYEREAITPGEPAHAVALGAAVYAKIAPRHEIPQGGGTTASKSGCLVMLLATAAAAASLWVR